MAKKGPPATDEQLEAMAPYAGVETAADMWALADALGGEVRMHCVEHFDTRPSANVRPSTGEFFCHTEQKGCSTRLLYEMRDSWIPVESMQVQKQKVHPRSSRTNGHSFHPPTLAAVRRWHVDLFGFDGNLEWLQQVRGISQATARRARLGWDGYFKIPVFDVERDVVNVRSYDPNPRDGRRKIWSVKGCGSPPQLYPLGVLARAEPGDDVLFCEGEWDTLLALQSGVRAVTRTSAARSLWHEDWDDYFADLHVYVCHDADWAGQDGNEIVSESVRDVAASVHVCSLPYEVERRAGKDVSNLILERGPEALWDVMASADRLGL